MAYFNIITPAVQPYGMGIFNCRSNSTYPNLNRVERAGSELGILRHEMEKKRRIMPLRKLFQSIPTLLLTLKPSLMMSPLSVAYFMDAEEHQFDMVIFDETCSLYGIMQG